MADRSMKRQRMTAAERKKAKDKKALMLLGAYVLLGVAIWCLCWPEPDISWAGVVKRCVLCVGCMIGAAVLAAEEGKCD